MALLTEEQVNDILDIANVCSSSTSAKKLIEWNEKQQPSTQFEPDWSKAPKSAVMAAINISWLTENGSWTLGYRLATYDRPTVTPHPHAALMAKYAEVAACRVDPWVEFEFRVDKREWETPTTGISFYLDFEYRHIGDNK